MHTFPVHLFQPIQPSHPSSYNMPALSVPKGMIHWGDLVNYVGFNFAQPLAHW